MKSILAKVADVKQISEGRHKIVFFEQKEVVIFNLKGEFYALENLCPHRKGPLSEGIIVDDTIVCPWHGARFDIKTGRGLLGPHRCDAKIFQIAVEGSEIRIVKTTAAKPH